MVVVVGEMGDREVDVEDGVGGSDEYEGRGKGCLTKKMKCDFFDEQEKR